MDRERKKGKWEQVGEKTINEVKEKNCTEEIRWGISEISEVSGHCNAVISRNV